MKETKVSKSDKVEFQRRIDFVKDKIISGYNTDELLALCITQFEVGERQAYKIISKAREDLKAINDKEIANRMEFHRLAIQRIYKKLIEAERYSEALVALRDLRSLDSLIKSKSLGSFGNVNELDETESGGIIIDGKRLFF